MASLGEGPLAGVRILDVTRILSGPFGSQVLADLGADVVKVEDPVKGDETRGYPPFYPKGVSHYFAAINRNKQSVAVDLRRPEGQQVVRRLVGAADVLLENFRPGRMAAWGLGYDDVRAANPRIIYCSISGFGPDGPLSGRVAFDIVTQAMAGAMSINGQPDGDPLRLGLPIGDLIGGLNAALGILAALRERDATGRGQLVDVSLFDGVLGLLGYLAQRYFLTGASPPRTGSQHLSLAPYGVFRVQDGHVVIAILVDSFWPKLCQALGAPELIEDDRFATNADRVANRSVLTAILESHLTRHPQATWEARFEAAGIPYAPIQTVGEALEHPQADHRRMVERVDHPTEGPMRVLGRPIKLSQHRDPPPLLPPPLLGQQTRSVLREWGGYADGDVDELDRQGVLAAPPEPPAPRAGGGAS